MSTGQQLECSSTQSALDARLDAIDRLLQGFIPRSERLAIVQQVEERVCSALASVPHPIPAAIDMDACLAEIPRSIASRAKHSKLAVSSGALGIAACALLLGMPLFYIGLNILGEMVDETVAILVVSSYLLTLLLGSAAAIALGAAALWRFRRLSPAVAGRGWALTGLCAGPIPCAIASLIILCWTVPMLSSAGFMIQTAEGVAVPEARPPEPQIQTVGGYAGGAPAADAPPAGQAPDATHATPQADDCPKLNPIPCDPVVSPQAGTPAASPLPDTEHAVPTPATTKPERDAPSAPSPARIPQPIPVPLPPTSD